LGQLEFQPRTLGLLPMVPDKERGKKKKNILILERKLNYLEENVGVTS
jgi:hypothetical protein